MPFMDKMWGKLVGKGWYYFLTDIRGIIIFLLHQNIKRKPLLLVHIEPLSLKECRLGCAMHPQHFRYV